MIYEKTPAGSVVANDKRAKVTGSLLALLGVVDGKTDSALYNAKLGTSGDQSQLLLALERQGLIRPVRGATKAALAPVEKPQEPSTMAKPSLFERLLGLGAGKTDRPQDEQTTQQLTERDDVANTEAFAPDTQTQGPDTQQLSADTHQMTQMIPRPGDREQSGTALKACLNHMSLFVQTHLPREAQALEQRLAEIHSFDELVLHLNAYERLIASAGIATSAHLSQLKAMIREHW
jgi:hypothetical protein